MNEPNQSIVQFVDDILCNAVCINASDIHFEIFESDFLIRYRVNGVLYDHAHIAREIAQPTITRIKLLAGLDTTESRRPQDGTIYQTSSCSTIEFRVSTLPTQFGESVVLRVLQGNKNIPNIYNLAANDRIFFENLSDIMYRRGMTIITGPTGCGKTTTIYSILNELNTDDVKILTCEDPVEYVVDGISQSNVNNTIGFTFSNILRSFLRHDPDIIVIGEIRDHETAVLAVQAALTGHIVFSTLHANDTVNAIPRLLDLGIEKNLLAEAIKCIIAQRLVAIKSGNHLSGRKAIFETLMFSDAIKAAIKSEKSVHDIRKIADAQGTISLKKYY